ncbi:hypothetical protein [Amycolatopsis sp. MJM2582]|uniref:hypothetical protein n=1 Tax=Amycolatopsis sp. MJM2582 TaxID=1427749 RepID=UPI0007C777AB|nr:hypothetical protein [Amycolatopsis sp. MJM2582]
MFLLAWTVLEMVNHGGGTIPLGIVGFIAPGLTLFVGVAAWHEAGQLPPLKAAAYNLVHRPIGPVLALVVVPFLPGDGPDANVGLFTLALGWLLHIVSGRALGTSAGSHRSPEVPGGAGGRGQVEAFEFVRDEGDHALGSLDLPTDQQRGAGSGDDLVPVPHR